MLLTAMSIEPRSRLNFWKVRIGIVTNRSWLWPSSLPLALGDADHLEGLRADADLAPDRIEPAEQLLGDFGADDARPSAGAGRRTR